MLKLLTLLLKLLIVEAVVVESVFEAFKSVVKSVDDMCRRQTQGAWPNFVAGLQLFQVTNYSFVATVSVIQLMAPLTLEML